MEDTDNLVGLKRVIIAIVAFFAIYLFLQIRESGFFSKNIRNKNRLLKEKNNTLEKAKELHQLHRKGVLDNSELEQKLESVKEDLVQIETELKLSNNENYILIVKSHKKGLITDKEKNLKIEKLKNELIKPLPDNILNF